MKHHPINWIVLPFKALLMCYLLSVILDLYTISHVKCSMFGKTICLQLIRLVVGDLDMYD